MIGCSMAGFIKPAMTSPCLVFAVEGSIGRSLEKPVVLDRALCYKEEHARDTGHDRRSSWNNGAAVK